MIKANREQIGDLEDLYLAEKRYANINSGKSKTVPLAEVMKEFGMKTAKKGRGRRAVEVPYLW